MSQSTLNRHLWCYRLGFPWPVLAVKPIKMVQCQWRLCWNIVDIEWIDKSKVSNGLTVSKDERYWRYQQYQKMNSIEDINGIKRLTVSKISTVSKEQRYQKMNGIEDINGIKRWMVSRLYIYIKNIVIPQSIAIKLLKVSQHFNILSTKPALVWNRKVTLSVRLTSSR